MDTLSLRFLISAFACLMLGGSTLAQIRVTDRTAELDDPCGLPDTTTAAFKLASSLNWGYSYDSLRADLQRWAQSPFVRIDSIGASVQNRALYMLTIEDTVPSPRKRVWIHARTHPNEVQGTWVTNQLIDLLLSPTPLGQLLRDSCVFNIVPMYNPDGVELAYPRQNANGVDLESNWNVNPGEPEVRALRAMFMQLMADPSPIRIALNMHSSISCTRYFVYHDANGTSALYATIEQTFINQVRSHFPGGIEPWTYFVSWTNGAPTYYPESWFWYNHQESVLALTYEDKNCAAAGGYDSTALALLDGIGDHLGVTSGVTAVRSDGSVPEQFSLEQNYPNPFNPVTTIQFTIPVGTYGRTSLRVYDLLGREVAVLVNENKEPGIYTVRFDARGIASGVYLYRLEVGEVVDVKRMVLLR
jgi:Zinc carboxypeptidase/Secretion system C-terminal sorting domain